MTNNHILHIPCFIILNAKSAKEPHREQEQRAVVVGNRGYPQDDRPPGGPGVHPGTHTSLLGDLGNDSANIERIVDKPVSIDINIWKYEHIRQFVLELNLLATSLKDLCTT
jgi:hypothetical protein